MLTASLVAGALMFALVRVEDAGACSCMGPRDVLVAPLRTESAPLNTRVRLETPAGQLANGRVKQPLFRVHGGANVETTSRAWADGYLQFFELTPKTPLAPNTQYEVAVVDTAEFPSTTVLGTFKTGTTSDTTAPKLGAIGSATAHGNAHAGGGDCSITGPWIDIGPVAAEDPGRPDAKLLYAIWVGDTTGNIDTTKPPAGLFTPYQGMVTAGKRSLCDPHDFPLPPKAQFVHLAIAAVDEAGNTSATQKLKVDMRSVPRPSP